MITVTVGLGGRSYPVLVGPGARTELGAVLPAGAARAAVVTQEGIPEVDPGIDHRVFEIGCGEEHKTLAALEELCRGFASWGLTRRDVVVAVGGGMVTDVGGFAAAVYHRGVPVVHVATTLLAQIDAAIGGKTGVNLPEGKNLVGAYWQPTGVICDTELLDTLPPREWRCGWGEMAKYHFLGAPELGALALDEQVARCVRLKAEVVADDEREGGRRAILNYGHTLAHALEIAGRFDLRHGEAVALGLAYAARVAHRLGRIDSARVAEHDAVLTGYGLSSALPAGSSASELVALFDRDKKALSSLTMVLDGPRGVEPVDGLDRDLLEETLDAMARGA